MSWLRGNWIPLVASVIVAGLTYVVALTLSEPQGQVAMLGLTAIIVVLYAWWTKSMADAAQASAKSNADVMERMEALITANQELAASNATIADRSAVIAEASRHLADETAQMVAMVQERRYDPLAERVAAARYDAYQRLLAPMALAVAATRRQGLDALNQAIIQHADVQLGLALLWPSKAAPSFIGSRDFTRLLGEIKTALKTEQPVDALEKRLSECYNSFVRAVRAEVGCGPLEGYLEALAPGPPSGDGTATEGHG